MKNTEKLFTISATPAIRVSRVRVRNYRSISVCDVRIGALTLLVGANGAGKRHFLDAMAFLADAVSTTPQQAIDSRNGLSEILRRAPELPTFFSILIDLTATWGDDESTQEDWSYGFEIRQAPDREGRAFDVAWEHAQATRSGRTTRYTVSQGGVDHPGLTHGTSVQPGQLFLPGASAVSTVWRRLGQALQGMHFHRLETSSLRLPQTAAGRAVLVGIEEPEGGLHPAAADALYGALTEASERVQVIAAMPMHRDDVDLDAVLTVSEANGSTIIRALDIGRHGSTNPADGAG